MSVVAQYLPALPAYPVAGCFAPSQLEFAHSQHCLASYPVCDGQWPLCVAAAAWPPAPFNPDVQPAADTHIRRPMNAFMVWAKTRRKQMAAEKPGTHNAVLSKHLGLEWKLMTNKQKQIYIEQSEEIRLQHMQAHPGYKYKPRRRKSKVNDPAGIGHLTEPRSATDPPLYLSAAKAALYFTNQNIQLCSHVHRNSVASADDQTGKQGTQRSKAPGKFKKKKKNTSSRKSITSSVIPSYFDGSTDEQQQPCYIIEQMPLEADSFPFAAAPAHSAYAAAANLAVQQQRVRDTQLSASVCLPDMQTQPSPGLPDMLGYPQYYNLQQQQPLAILAADCSNLEKTDMDSYLQPYDDLSATNLCGLELAATGQIVFESCQVVNCR